METESSNASTDGSGAAPLDASRGPVSPVPAGHGDAPGSNVKGRIAGANWMFLRPRLDAECCLCLGAPSPAALAMLTRFGRQVVVAVGSNREARNFRRRLQGAQGDRVRLVVIGPDGQVPLDPATGVDVLFVARWRMQRRLRRDARLRASALGLLAADGVVYYEHRGPFDPLLQYLVDTAGGRPPLLARRFRLTPLIGEMQSAVPVGEDAIGAYFHGHGLDRPSLTIDDLQRFARKAMAGWGLRRRRRGTGAGALRGSSPATDAAFGPANGGSRRLTGVAAALRSSVSVVSRIVDRHPVFERLGRGAVVLGPASIARREAPAYLKPLAAAAGLQLSDFRWGLSARGEYQSRKVLFLLFDRRRPVPAYIIKLVREPALNGRLEREYNALRRLAERGIGDEETVPRALSFGYHAGLAMVCETVIDGAPFRARTTRRAECRSFRGAVELLTAMAAGSATAADDRSGIGSIVEDIFERFSALYRPTPSEHAFLAGQVEALRAAGASLRRPFQHGDPGPWNMLVTPAGRVALIDWEAAGPDGMPLWDLFYFLRAYCADAVRARGGTDRVRGLLGELLGETPLGAAVVGATRRYCAVVGVPVVLIEPLFYTCWMHRAVKEAARLTQQRLARGHYANLVRAAIAVRKERKEIRLFDAKASVHAEPGSADWLTHIA